MCQTEMAARRLPTVIAVRDMNLHKLHATGNYPASLFGCSHSPTRRGGGIIRALKSLFIMVPPLCYSARDGNHIIANPVSD